jgi:hypothetical protein
MEMLQSVELQCPYCGEHIEITVDCSEPSQEYVEDCSVCCNPMLLSILAFGTEDIQVEARAENE